MISSTLCVNNGMKCVRWWRWVCNPLLSQNQNASQWFEHFLQTHVHLERFVIRAYSLFLNAARPDCDLKFRNILKSIICKCAERRAGQLNFARSKVFYIREWKSCNYRGENRNKPPHCNQRGSKASLKTMRTWALVLYTSYSFSELQTHKKA